MSRLLSLTVLLLASVGVCLNLRGLSHESWPVMLPWNGLPELEFALCVLLGLSAWYLFWLRIAKCSLIGVCAFTFASVLLLVGHLWAGVVAVWFVLASQLYGLAALRVLCRESAELESTPSAVLLGLGLLGTVVGLMSHFPVAYPGTYGLLLALPLLIWRKDLVLSVRRLKGALLVRHSAFTWHAWLVDAITGALLTFHLLVALLPEHGADAMATHLFIPTHLSVRHQWGFDASTYAWALMPKLGNWIISPAYLLGGEVASKLVNFGFMLVLLAQTRDLSRWLGGTSSSKRMAGLLLLTTPLVFAMNSTLQMEFIWSGFVLAAISHLVSQGSAHQELRHHHLMAAIFLGLAVAAKAVVLSMLPLFALLMLAQCLSQQRCPRLSDLGLAMAVFLLLGGIPYVTAWWLSGNPVFPMFNGVFKSPLFPSLDFNNRHYNWPLTWTLLYDLNFRAERYMESSVGGGGFHWLLLPAVVGWAFLRRRARAWMLLLLVLGMILLVFRSQSYLRYVFPALPILAGLCATALTVPVPSGRVLRSMYAVVWGAVIVLNLAFLPAATWTYRQLPLKVLFSDEQRQRWLMQVEPIRLAVDHLNQINPEGAPVAAFTRVSHGLGLHSDLLLATWYHPSFLQAARQIDSDDAALRVLARFRTPYVILDERWFRESVRQHVRSVTTEVATYGPFSVRRVADRFGFLNNQLPTGVRVFGAPWQAVGKPRYLMDEDAVNVTLADYLRQWVAIEPHQKYRHRIESRCGQSQEAVARLQVSWEDAHHRFMDANVAVFPCSKEWAWREFDVHPPEGAVRAVLHLMSHTQESVEIRKVQWASQLPVPAAISQVGPMPQTLDELVEE